MKRNDNSLSDEEIEINKLINFEKTDDNLREMQNILKAKEKFNEFMDAYNKINKKYQLTAFEMCFKEINHRKNKN